jgi:hypothetical protein
LGRQELKLVHRRWPIPTNARAGSPPTSRVAADVTRSEKPLQEAVVDNDEPIGVELDVRGE